ncbi:MAG: formyltransferase family protein [Hydrogenovibrio sp.]|uniref:formyltransferase family protein n=1 Tax=Hydrogenovibrio sp. TaxID=2065821 RepID=UPI0028706D1C|nr:formyltransferase family protein [Hydrogenovibrio sp.]MDR9498510.1 formyltransferase family protein [Hydrogenovibrio sp.]MDR9499260.1 formyltransferase family protein [Hydrogenovibrio sp.]
MVMKNIAFYVMNSKGLFVLKNYIEKFGANAIDYVVSEQDKAVQYDGFQEIKQLAQSNNIPFYPRTKFDVEIENKFSGLKFAIGWRWLIKNETNLIVFHDSLLPKFRGFAPLVNSLINKELRGGVTALFADCKYDRGDIIAQKSTDFSYPIKIEEAIRQIEPLYFELVDKIYTRQLAGEPLTGYKQDENQATYSLWLDHEDYFIDWTWPSEKIKRFVDAVGYPYDGAKARLNDEVINFKEVDVPDDVVVEHRERHIGKVIFIEQGLPVIVCKQGLLALKEITDENGRKVRINFRSRFK